jgi:hypothetical protein
VIIQLRKSMRGYAVLLFAILAASLGIIANAYSAVRVKKKAASATLR